MLDGVVRGDGDGVAGGIRSHGIRNIPYRRGGGAIFCHYRHGVIPRQETRMDPSAWIWYDRESDSEEDTMRQGSIYWKDAERYTRSVCLRAGDAHAYTAKENLHGGTRAPGRG